MRWVCILFPQLALDAVLRGERYISDSLARKLAERHLPGNGKTPFDQLTHRELQILLLVSEGKTTSAIARDLCLTNFSEIVSHVLVPPAMEAILAAPNNRVQGFLAAGTFFVDFFGRLATLLSRCFHACSSWLSS